MDWSDLTYMFTAQGMEEFDALEKGSWSELPTGGHVWRLRIVSPGASSHTLVFRSVEASPQRECCTQHVQPKNKNDAPLPAL